MKQVKIDTVKIDGQDHMGLFLKEDGCGSFYFAVGYRIVSDGNGDVVATKFIKALNKAVKDGYKLVVAPHDKSYDTDYD